MSDLEKLSIANALAYPIAIVINHPRPNRKKLSFEIPGIGFIDRVVIDAKADWQYTRYDDFAFLPERKALVLGGGLLFEL